ncbi:MAG TPA: redoxin domain-containing protein [Chthonomonadales bacterium]|nr:redoxin domain-containing protein [Chthonomonadales bacterium]
MAITLLIPLSGLLAANAAAPEGSKIGAKPANLRFRDLKGQIHSLRAPNSLPAVYLFLSTQCPVANRYTSRMIAMERVYRGQGVRFIGVNANANESAADVLHYARARGFTFPIVKDDGSLATRLGATMTPQAVVLDREGVIRYRGRLDDNVNPTEVKSHDLKDAIDAVLSGKPVPRAETAAFGCIIRHKPLAASVKTATVTYTRDVAPILRQNCLVCHRKGEVAPFSLETYEQAAAWAQQIKAYTANRKMPPWKAESHGEFLNERRLTDRQIATLAAWADSCTPKGDPKYLLPAPKFPSGWRLGQPDAVIQMPEPYLLEADGRDVYRCFVIPTDYPQDRYLSAIEFHPGNRTVVHHVIAYIDTRGAARKLDEKDPGPGYSTTGGGPGFAPSGFLGGWAPGNEPRLTPEGVGILLPKGADIVLEVHYHKSGKPETDLTKAGLYFCKSPVNKRMRILPVVNLFIQIPPGAENHGEKAAMPVLQDITIFSVMPHMHLLGRSMRVYVEFPDKSEKQLVYVPDWDFNWQITYQFKEPLKIPKGSLIRLVATYDNTEKNPNNPNKPPKEVRWGEQTTDEMCLAFIGYTVDSEQLAGGLKAADVAMRQR